MAARNDPNEVLAAVQRAVGGDTAALDLVADLPHSDLCEAVGNVELLLTRPAVTSVIRRLLGTEIAGVEAQRWASFVRRGYCAGSIPGPIKPLDIAYDGRWEAAIVAAVSRLDEIGDAVDGVPDPGEWLDLMQLLGEENPAL